MIQSRRTKGAAPVFRLKASTKPEKPIFLDYSYGRKKRFKYSIGYSVNPDYWIGDKGKVKNVRAVTNAKMINDRIDDLTRKLKEFVEDCDSNQIPLTNPIIKACLDDFRNENEAVLDNEEKEITTLIAFVKNYIIQKEKELPKASNGYKNNTIKSYEQTLEHLRGYERENKCILDFDLDNEFYSDFTEYMNAKTYQFNKKEVKHYSLNTIGKQIKNLKVFMGAALVEDYHSNLKYKRFKVKTEITTAIYLEIVELKSMYELDLRATPHLELARDIFLIGCEIGQRISDYHNLQAHEIVPHENERYIKIKQEKTKKEVLCKITPVIEAIMNQRYGGNLPPKITEQKLNDYIKIVGEKAEINSQIKVEITRGGKRKVNHIPKYQLIQGHSARRTFCTLKYKAGVPVHSILELSGHSTLKEFMKYIRNPKVERVSQITSTDAFQVSSIPV
ncbi:site-specific recombinase XerD [Jejuia pallidilutea]|uniref:Site-specific recombinase XerD n=1 Tax=Jejuia pallidilutea TaxID=504487 RepID=A0A362XDD1_9FLAO|nr:phage integrase SAM-like domain-containing protein [Jejuia pallidilutea]PQV51230.1 site-specific recombinase XerD [Jejuia pallidilutea]